jgi:hypothetical protein
MSLFIKDMYIVVANNQLSSSVRSWWLTNWSWFATTCPFTVTCAGRTVSLVPITALSVVQSASVIFRRFRAGASSPGFLAPATTAGVWSCSFTSPRDS